MKDTVGDYATLVERRVSLVRNLSPAARSAAFPTVYARPFVVADPIKPLHEKIAQQRERIAHLETENERLRSKFLADAKAQALAADSMPRTWITIDDVLKEFCAAVNSMGYRIYGHPVTLIDLACQQRSRVYVYPRHVAMWLCTKLTKASLPRIGHAFGGRDHTSVMHGRTKAPSIFAEVPSLKAAAMIVQATFESRS